MLKLKLNCMIGITKTMDRNLNKGFTIVETLIAIFIFAIIMGAAFNSVLSLFSSQRYRLASQKVADEVSLLTESLARELREAQRDGGGICIAANYSYEEITSPGPGIKFLDLEFRCREVALELMNKRVVERIGLSPSDSWYVLSSENISIEAFEFNLIGQEGGSPDNTQPRVTVFIDAVAKNFPGGDPPRVKMQTTISQRNLDAP